MSGNADLLKLVGRLALAFIFVAAGANKLADLATFQASLEGMGAPAPGILAILAVACELGGGLALALGLQARLGALALVAFTIVATFLAHRFWQVEDPQAQFVQQIMFMKNFAIIGGLLYAIAAGPGRFSIDGRRGG